jgi:hypothetical protein
MPKRLELENNGVPLSFQLFPKETPLREKMQHTKHRIEKLVAMGMTRDQAINFIAGIMIACADRAFAYDPPTHMSPDQALAAGQAIGNGLLRAANQLDRDND